MKSYALGDSSVRERIQSADSPGTVTRGKATAMVVEEPLVTPEMEAHLGVESEPVPAVDEVCRSEIRRYVIVTMDDNPLWFDTAYAEKIRYRAGCAPGSYPLRAVGGYHREMGTRDHVRSLRVNDDARGVDEHMAWPEGVPPFTVATMLSIFNSLASAT